MADREMTNEEAIEILSGIRACYNFFDEYDELKYAALSKAIFALKAEPVEFEWCTDCKEYDQEAHCCHRWTKVIRNTVNDLKTQGYEPVRNGHWVKNDNGTFSCSECHSWVPNEQHYYARYCLYCGAKMEVIEQ